MDVPFKDFKVNKIVSMVENFAQLDMLHRVKILTSMGVDYNDVIAEKYKGDLFERVELYEIFNYSDIIASLEKFNGSIVIIDDLPSAKLELATLYYATDKMIEIAKNNSLFIIV
jgi:hypothetical protein